MSPWFYHHEASWICKHLSISFPCVAFSLFDADTDNFILSHQQQLLLPPLPWQRGSSACPPSAGCLLLPIRSLLMLPPHTAGRTKSFSDKGLLYQKINLLTSNAFISAPLHVVIFGKDTPQCRAHSLSANVTFAPLQEREKEKKKKKKKAVVFRGHPEEWENRLQREIHLPRLLRAGMLVMGWRCPVLNTALLLVHAVAFFSRWAPLTIGITVY